eukprot:CAMPEP_0116825780 /NCGR_PEP_ID=MMETSP0418-20121206/2164_1 /TAXON_ID=1158023 /ORGANISM="Astrosyne radiata, Strain 13vi08-1A" /LENGTH=118 /DNA_ID=CAMNT_0004454343 /DNA_START=181 /DNA_END=537 /DNA_ORIENTATION=-
MTSPHSGRMTNSLAMIRLIALRRSVGSTTAAFSSMKAPKSTRVLISSQGLGRSIPLPASVLSSVKRATAGSIWAPNALIVVVQAFKNPGSATPERITATASGRSASGRVASHNNQAVA